jgi:hypothetical protein
LQGLETPKLPDFPQEFVSRLDLMLMKLTQELHSINKIISLGSL